MDISSILTPSGVIPALRSGAKKAVLEELAEKAAEVTGRSATEIFSVLLDREKLGSTGVGGGVAIPHGKLSDLDRLYMVFAVQATRSNLMRSMNIRSICSAC